MHRQIMLMLSIHRTLPIEFCFFQILAPLAYFSFPYTIVM